MHELVSFNGEVLRAEEARVAAAGGASLYGRGAFTTVAVYRGRPFLWDAHWSRLVEHARRAGVEHDFAEGDVTAALGRLLEANGVGRGRARVSLLAREGSGVWRRPGAGGAGGAGGEAKAEAQGEGRDGADLLIMTGDARRDDGRTLALTVSPHRLNTLSPLAGVKSTSYLEHLMAWEEARSRDFDEAVVLNERGEVASASMANLWVSRGTIHTPALATGAMAGTTRARVIELAQEMAFPVVEGAHGLRELAEAEEIFLTSAGLGLGLVTAFDFHRYTVPVGSVALRLHEAFRQLTLGAM